MKVSPHLVTAALLGSVLLAGAALGQSVTLEKTVNYVQTGAGTLTQTGSPYEFQAIVRHANNIPDFADWGPVLKLPGGSSSPAGRNFPTAPNSNGDYLVFANFADAGALDAAFASGSYSIEFAGSAVSPSEFFTAGLAFNSGGFASGPLVDGVDKGATWSNGLLIRNTGITTLTLSDFAEYALPAYEGTIITVGIRDSLGHVVSAASRLAEYVPSAGPGYLDAVIDEFELDPTWLTLGGEYQLQIQYGILGSAPASDEVDGVTFDGLALYYSSTMINLTVIPEPSTTAALLGLGVLGLVTLRRRSVGRGV
jgi:hypothetical protein